MKRFSEKDFADIENNMYSVGIELSLVTSLIKVLYLAMNAELDINRMDMANLAELLNEKIRVVNEKYNKITWANINKLLINIGLYNFEDLVILALYFIWEFCERDFSHNVAIFFLFLDSLIEILFIKSKLSFVKGGLI